MTDVYWRLYYAGGDFQDEPPGGGTILDSRVGPLVLALCHEIEEDGRRVRVPFVRVDLLAHEIDGNPWRPVFYRNKSLDLHPGQELGAARTDETVFGRARTMEGREAVLAAQAAGGDVNVEVELFVTDGSAVANCPPAAFREGAVNNLLFSR